MEYGVLGCIQVPGETRLERQDWREETGGLESARAQAPEQLELLACPLLASVLASLLGCIAVYLCIPSASSCLPACMCGFLKSTAPSALVFIVCTWYSVLVDISLSRASFPCAVLCFIQSFILFALCLFLLCLCLFDPRKSSHLILLPSLSYSPRAHVLLPSSFPPCSFDPF